MVVDRTSSNTITTTYIGLLESYVIIVNVSGKGIAFEFPYFAFEI